LPFTGNGQRATGCWQLFFGILLAEMIWGRIVPGLDLDLGGMVAK